MVDGPELLVAVPRKRYLVVWVPGLELRIEPGDLLLGEVLGAHLQRPADPFINKIMAGLNAAIQNEVTQRAGKGWFYIGGIAKEFRGHGYCTGDSYFVFAEESLAQQGDTRGSVHPNQKGVEKIARHVRDETLKNTISNAQAPGQAPTNAGQAPLPQPPAPSPDGQQATTPGR